MIEVHVEQEIDAPAAAVWELLGNAERTDSWPAVESFEVEGSGVGATRTMHLVGNECIRERWEVLDPETRSYRAHVIEPGRLPVQDLTYGVVVRPDGPDHCTVSWTMTFMPKGVSEERARTLIQGVFVSTKASIRETLGV